MRRDRKDWYGWPRPAEGDAGPGEVLQFLTGLKKESSLLLPSFLNALAIYRAFGAGAVVVDGAGVTVGVMTRGVLEV